MAQFRYRAYSLDDQTEMVEDVIEAASVAEAAQLLLRSNLQAVRIEPVSNKKSVDFDALNNLLQRVKPQQLADFTTMLSLMLHAGMTILQALEVCERGVKNPLLKRVVADVREQVNQGGSPAEAMAKHPRVFSPLYLALIEAGESSGKLEDSLDRLVEALTKQAEMRREVRSAMMYPSVVLTFSVVVFMVMMWFVVPTFANMFAEDHSKLPFLTARLVSISKMVKTPAFMAGLLLGGPAAIYGFRRYIKTPRGRLMWGTFKLRAPKIGPLTQMIVTARLFRTLAALYEGGIPLLSALQIASPTADNGPFEACMVLVAEDVRNGGNLAESFHKHQFLPDMADSMLLAGDSAGSVEKMLDHVAETYEKMVATQIKSIKSLVEPVMMVVIGAIVGTTVVGLYQPMFQVYNHIH